MTRSLTWQLEVGALHVMHMEEGHEKERCVRVRVRACVHFPLLVAGSNARNADGNSRPKPRLSSKLPLRGTLTSLVPTATPRSTLQPRWPNGPDERSNHRPPPMRM